MSCANPKNTIHKQVFIEFQDQQAFVDEEIQDLILSCWKQGFKTNYSCQEQFFIIDGKRVPFVQVCFIDIETAFAFARFVAKKYNTIQRYIERYNPFESQCWEYKVLYSSKPMFQPNGISIKFPKEHLACVRAALATDVIN